MLAIASTKNSLYVWVTETVAPNKPDFMEFELNERS